MSIHSPIMHDAISKKGIKENGKELKPSLNPSILVDKFWSSDLFDIYLENKLTKPKRVNTGMPQL